MSDIVEQLRVGPQTFAILETERVMFAAADEIERLRAVLKPFAQLGRDRAWSQIEEQHIEDARRALEDK